MEGEQRIEWRS